MKTCVMILYNYRSQENDYLVDRVFVVDARSFFMIIARATLTQLSALDCIILAILAHTQSLAGHGS
jgi:hypothetical protein